MDCLFCKIAKKEIPGHIIYEDDTVIAFLDIHPNVDGHTLIIPKKHFEDFTELDKETLFHMKEVAAKLSEEIMEKLHKKGMTLTINYKDAQEIKHVHLHLLPDLQHKTKLHPLEEILSMIKNEKSRV
ncbi:MAG: HIT domain-containing protein [Bacilli bacterium]|nr:HIT domain-containing protein [Bacilli bacterium]